MGGFRSKAHITNTQHKPFVWTAQTSNGQGTQLLHAQSMPLEGPPGSWLVREGGCARTQDTDPAGTRIPPRQSSLLPTRTCCPARFETVPVKDKLNLNAKMIWLFKKNQQGRINMCKGPKWRKKVLGRFTLLAVVKPEAPS